MKRITRPIELTPQKLAELRFRYRPGGSGPLGCMRQIVQLVEQIAADVATELRTLLQDHLAREGADVVANRPGELKPWIDAEIAKWKIVIGKSGITPE